MKNNTTSIKVNLKETRTTYVWFSLNDAWKHREQVKTVQQGVGVDTLKRKAALAQIKPEGEGALIAVVRAVWARLVLTRTMMAWCK